MRRSPTKSLETYEITAEDRAAADALRLEFGDTFITLAHVGWELFPQGFRCESWKELAIRLSEWTMKTGHSRSQVAKTWMDAWVQHLSTSSDAVGALSRALDTLAVIRD